MAHFNVCFVNRNNIVTESVVLSGCKMDKKNKDYDYYYVRLPNKYGIRWIVMNKDSWQGSDVCATRELPHYSYIRIYKLFK